MEIVIVKENEKFRVLEGKGEVSEKILSLRSRLTNGDQKYYILDYKEMPGCPLEGYIAALNMYPELINSALIKAI